MAADRDRPSGVDVVATYFFWNYHEETPGKFDWTGDRDARRFVEAAARHGLKVVLRLGPWSHGEVRYGEWTREGRLRHPSWRGLRDDVPPEQVVVEP